MFSTILEQNVLVKKWILEQIERNSAEGGIKMLRIHDARYKYIELLVLLKKKGDIHRLSFLYF